MNPTTFSFRTKRLLLFPKMMTPNTVCTQLGYTRYRVLSTRIGHCIGKRRKIIITPFFASIIRMISLLVLPFVEILLHPVMFEQFAHCFWVQKSVLFLLLPLQFTSL